LEHCEVVRIDDPERRERIREEIRARLKDVVAATDDFQPMLEALDDTIREVGEYRSRFPERDAELEEVQEFLRWLKQDNFVFLGYRAYGMERRDGEPVGRVEPGTGLGILRD